MILYAFLDGSGIPTGGGSNRAMPAGAIEITPPWTLRDLPRIMHRDGVWVERPPAPPPPPPSAEEVKAREASLLSAARVAAALRVNARVDALRRIHYTVIAGQDALYMEKRAEALAYVAETAQGGEPADLDEYPLIGDEIGVTAPSAWQIAQIWLHLSSAFKALGRATERPRLVALKAIAAAPDTDSIAGIEAALGEALARRVPQDAP